MRKFKKLFTLTFMLIVGSMLLTACGSNAAKDKDNTAAEDNKILSESYNDYVNQAKGSTVTFYGWGGSDLTNSYIDNYIGKIMKNKYNITVKRVPMDTEEIINNLQSSVQSGEDKSNIDVMWVNGENFYAAMKNNLLFGPFVDKLPNIDKYVNKDADDIKYDFGYETKGYEAPFGKAQLVMIYNSDKVKPVTSADNLMQQAKANPGKFTYPALPDFTGSAFVRNIIYEKVGYDKLKDIDPNDEEAVKKAIQPAMDYLKELKPYLWKEGKSYPADVTQQDNMFADGTLYFDVSYNPNFAANMIEKGTFPKSTKTSLFDNGTIGNTHFLAIAKNAPNKAGAMLLINEIESYQGQLEKYKPEVWGDLPVIDNSKLSDQEKNEIESLKLPEATIPQSELMTKRIPELPSALVPVIEKIWMEEIPEN